MVQRGLKEKIVSVSKDNIDLKLQMAEMSDITELATLDKECCEEKVCFDPAIVVFCVSWRVQGLTLVIRWPFLKTILLK